MIWSLFFRVCSGFGWDKDGALLSIINDRSPLVHVWDANSGKLMLIINHKFILQHLFLSGIFYGISLEYANLDIQIWKILIRKYK